MELPLNDVGSTGPPSQAYLLGLNALNMLAGILWCIAYVLYIRQSHKDRSYGMPLLPLSVESSLVRLYQL